MSTPLRRSRSDRKLAGVCSGIAEAHGYDVDTVRMFTMVGALIASPVALAYLAAATLLPEGGEPPPAEVRWDEEALSVRWFAPIAPWSVPWLRWAAGVAAACGGLVLATLIAWTAALMLTDLAVAVPTPANVVTLLGVFGAAWPAAFVALGLGLTQRAYGLTLTNEALRVERPLRRERVVALHELARVEAGEDRILVTLTDGEQLALPPTDTQTARTLEEQLEGARGRADRFREDLADTESERRRVARLMAERARE